MQLQLEQSFRLSPRWSQRAHADVPCQDWNDLLRTAGLPVLAWRWLSWSSALQSLHCRISFSQVTHMCCDMPLGVPLGAGLALVPSGLAAPAAGIQDRVAKTLLLCLRVLCVSLCCLHQFQSLVGVTHGGACLQVGLARLAMSDSVMGVYSIVVSSPFKRTVPAPWFCSHSPT